MFAVKAEVLKKLLESSEWRRKLEEAKTLAEAEKVLVDFCKINGYRVKRFK